MTKRNVLVTPYFDNQHCIDFSGNTYLYPSLHDRIGMLNYQTVLVQASESNEASSQINSNAEKRGNIDLTEASSSERER